MESALYSVSTQHLSPCWSDFDGDLSVVWCRPSSPFLASSRKEGNKKRRFRGGPDKSWSVPFLLFRPTCSTALLLLEFSLEQ